MYAWPTALRAGNVVTRESVALYPEQDLLIIVLGNRIWYREWLGLYLHVDLPATQLREALEEAIATGRYDRLPSAKLSAWLVPSVGIGGFGGLLARIAFRGRRRKALTEQV